MAERAEEIEKWETLTIPAQQQKPDSLASDEVPDVACMQIDGGRLQIWDRDEETVDVNEEATGNAASKTSKTFWREDKVGICLSMTSKEDPCPLIPNTFVDPERMSRLAREIKSATKPGGPNVSAAKRKAFVPTTADSAGPVELANSGSNSRGNASMGA